MTFASRFFGEIKTVVCDRHHAQRNTIVRVFGERVNVLHCCVRAAQNIQRNAEVRSDPICLFWAMRFTRTEDSERAFNNILERLQNTIHILFTTPLMMSLDTFVQSPIRDAFDVVLFPELDVLGQFDTTRFVLDYIRKTRVARLLEMLGNIGLLQSYILSLSGQHKLDRRQFQNRREWDSFECQGIIGHLLCSDVQ